MSLTDWLQLDRLFLTAGKIVKLFDRSAAKVIHPGYVSENFKIYRFSFGMFS
jgi:acetyl/propionyl-CoA carboxylase alpha subunit